MLTRFQIQAIVSRFEGWELAEYLQVSAEDLLYAAIENAWINEDNIEDLFEFVNLKEEDTE